MVARHYDRRTNMITIKQQFVHFLKDNNVYEKYMFYFKADKYYKNSFFVCPKKVTFDYFVSKVKKENYISFSFDWKNTTEGYDFWGFLSSEWRKCINSQGYKLIDFLKENNVYEQFIDNFKQSFKYYNYETLEMLIETYNPTNYINYAFDWDKTKEGWEYWNIVNIKWISYLSNNFNIN